jgi:hypothetical protein
MAGNHALVIHHHQFARLDLAFEIGAHHIERHGFAGEHDGIADAAHHQRADAQRIAAGDHARIGHADQRIGAFDQPQRIDEAIEQRGIARWRPGG